MYRMVLLVIVAAVALAAAGCGGSDADGAGAQTSSASQSGRDLPRGSEPVNLDPAGFTTKIDNPY
jgi:hypothetical protein